MKHLVRFLLGVVAIAACWGAWWVTYKDSLARTEVKKTAKTTATVAVEVVEVQQHRLSDRIELVGSLSASAELQVRARTSGYIKQMQVDVGDRVAAGAELARLDDSEQSEMVAQATAALNVTKAQLKAQETDLVLSEKTMERQRNLSKGGAGTGQQFEQAEAAVQIAAAKVDLEKSRVAEAESNLERAKLGLEDLKLTAPIAGVVAERMVDEGNLAAPATPMLRIIDYATVRTTVNVTEKHYPGISVGKPAEVTVDAFPGRIFTGEITRIAPVIDLDTRTAAVRIDIPNAELLLKPGMYARVAILAGGDHESPVIPQQALLNEQPPAVFVVTGTPPLALRRRVTLGTTNGVVAEVVSGLTAGEFVMTLGNRIVQEGQEVTVSHTQWSPTNYRESVSR